MEARQTNHKWFHQWCHQWCHAWSKFAQTAENAAFYAGQRKKVDETVLPYSTVIANPSGGQQEGGALWD